ncbi:MAG: class I SAM-dependent rRNA methyltransferase [Sphaerochaetaceae bacterium]
MQNITITSGKEKQLLRHHPWVFSKAISSPVEIEDGVCRVVTAEGRFIAWGWYDSKSHIVLHLLSWDEKDVIDDAWWVRTMRNAVQRRAPFFSDKTSPSTTFRIIFSEADMLPGIVADVYGTMVRIIISSHIAWMKKELLVKTINSMLHPSLIVITTDSSYTSVESIPQAALFWKDGAYFTPAGKLPAVRFREDNLLFETIPGMGQKSGFYCDQRENRVAIEPYCKNATVLDGFCYTGAFTLHALRSGAKSIDCLDSSDDALHQLLYHVHINQDAGTIPQGSREKVTTKVCDIFEEMRQITNNKYDLMILDPPKLAQTKSQAENAAKAYKDLNRLAMQKIRNGGIIATFSCSGAVTAEMFRTILAWSAQDSKVELQILRTLGAGSDHPIRISFPESEYLKGYILRVLK